MTNDEKMLLMVEKLAEDKVKKDDTVKKFKNKDKIKKLTEKERVDFLYEFLGL